MLTPALVIALRAFAASTFRRSPTALKDNPADTTLLLPQTLVRELSTLPPAGTASALQVFQDRPAVDSDFSGFSNA